MMQKALLPETSLNKFSEEKIETIYALGYNYYENGKYEEAVHFFRYLTLVDHSSQRNWIGLGACHQMLKQYDTALQSFAFSATLNKDNPFPHLFASECFSALGNKNKATDALNIAEKNACEDKEKFKDLLDHINLIKEEKDG